jgi:NitT/TauT family transport system substrate-binding protein
MARKIWILVLFCIIGIVSASCSQSESPATDADPVTLRIAVLPILDALPMYVAQEEGLFDKHEVNVEFIPAASAAERDQIITAGQADGLINETVSTLFYNQDEIQIQIVRFARIATPTSPQFFILAAGQSGITEVEELRNVEIGISEGTVIEYITDRLLEAEGFEQSEINTIAVPKIPDRMALLNSGELSAATLPDPLSSLAVQQGARVIVDDSSHPEYSYSTISFIKSIIDQHPEAIRGFLAAIEEAVEAVNADPSKYEELLVEKELVPAPLAGSYEIPPYPLASVPSQTQWNDVIDWAQGKDLISKDVSYQDSVNDSFLP